MASIKNAIRNRIANLSKPAFKKPRKRYYRGVLLKRGTSVNSHGYLVKSIRIGKRVTNVKVHRLAMENHLGRPLLKSEAVHHIDGNKLNNHIGNLEIMSRREHAIRHNTLANWRESQKLALRIKLRHRLLNICKVYCFNKLFSE